MVCNGRPLNFSRLQAAPADREESEDEGEEVEIQEGEPEEMVIPLDPVPQDVNTSSEVGKLSWLKQFSCKTESYRYVKGKRFY